MSNMIDLFEDKRTIEELREDLQEAREFIAIIDADPFLRGDGAQKERNAVDAILRELARRDAPDHP
jgi:hypothetical protein